MRPHYHTGKSTQPLHQMQQCMLVTKVRTIGYNPSKEGIKLENVVGVNKPE